MKTLLHILAFIAIAVFSGAMAYLFKYTPFRRDQ